MKNIKEEILKILENPTSPTEIKKKLKDVNSFGTIAYHLKQLEEEGVITKEKDNKKQGQPTKYKLNSPEIRKRIKISNEEEEKRKIAFLNCIKENPLKEDAVIMNMLENEGFDDDWMAETSMNCNNENLAVFCWKITKKGENFLKQNSKDKNK